MRPALEPPLPRLHLITDDRVLRNSRFPETASAILATYGPAVALHLRGHGLTGAELYHLAETLAPPATAAGALLLVNDRVDMALAVGAGGVQLGRRSLPLPAAQRLLGPGRWLGYSAHGALEVIQAEADGADFVVFGTIFPSATPPGEPTAGVEGLREIAHITSLPLIGIGGMTPARVAAVRGAGAYGVAVLGGIWHGPNPETAAGEFLKAIQEVS
jgi:thiamine-phosphate pyrophosphorylase